MSMKVLRMVALLVSFVALFALNLPAEFGPSWDSAPNVILRPPIYVVHPGTDGVTQRFEIPAGQSKDRWIRAIQFQSCDPQLVQSAFFYVDKTGQWLGRSTPSEKSIVFPETVAAYLPTTAKVVIEIHYNQVSQDSEDCSSIGLYFTDKKPLRPLMGMGIQSPVQIPGGTALELKKEFTVIQDSYAIALQPELQATGRSLAITAVDPSGSSQILYDAKDLNGSSQAHVFAEPVFIPKGTRIIATASYQNRNSQAAVEDVFKLKMSMYPSAEFRPPAYDASIGARRGTKPAPLKKTVAAQTKKPTSKKSATKKKSL